MDWLEHIKKIKKEKGFKNETLSETSNIPLGTINKLFAGQTEDPKLSTLTALAQAFGMSLDEMLGTGNKEVFMDPELLKQYSELDNGGRESVDQMIMKEHQRVLAARKMQVYTLDAPNIKRIKLFDTAVSAGTGMVLADSSSEYINVYVNPVTESADFAVRVNGNSMMPKYSNGDIILAEQTESVSVGEIGIFLLNGESYVKKFGGNRLISLNPEYKDIMIHDYDDLSCFGRVLGRIRK